MHHLLVYSSNSKNQKLHGGASLSYVMLSVYLVGSGLWLIYGVVLHASAIIVANAVSIVLVATAILMKAIVET